MVGHDDHQRAVVDPFLLQPPHDQAEGAVGVLHLQQEPLVGLQSRPRPVPAVSLDAAQERGLDAVSPAGGQVEVGHVRQQRMEDIERRPTVA